MDDNSDNASEKSIFREKLSDEERALYRNLSREQINEYKEIFDIFDAAGDGTINNDEIGKVMQGLGESPTPERIDELIAMIDYDGDGEVDFDEFVCLMVKTLYDADKAEEELVEVFRKFDKNGDNVINPQDLMVAFHELGYACEEEEA